MVRDAFPPAWLREQYSLLQRRGVAAFQQVWGATAPAGNRGLRTIKDASKKTFERLRAMPWQTIARRYKVSLLVLGGVLLAIVLLMIIIKVPQRQAASWRGQPGVELKDLPKLENDARTTLIQGLGGAVLLIGLYLTLRNLQLTQDRQITEHYTRAVEQLGSSQIEVRLGGIYALERIARDSERDHWPIMEILTAYVRENAPRKEEEQPTQEEISPRGVQLMASGKHRRIFEMQDNQPRPKLARDIQAVLSVLGRRTRTYRKGEDYRLDLSYTNLRGVDLDGAQLQGAFLERAQLQGAFLVGAQLRGAILHDAQLQGAKFWGAQLQGAILHDAQLQGANLEGAELQRARLRGAQLQGAILHDAQLQGAILEGAELIRANDLTVEQLATVKTLYGAHLDPPLLEQIQQQYPHLLEKPQD